MTTNNHPAHGPVSLDRLHQISEILSKAAAQSDGGNLGYAMADAVKVIDVAIAAFSAEPVAWRYRYVHTPKTEEHGYPFTTEWKLCDSEDECNPSDCFERQPLYTAQPVPELMKDHQIRELVNDLRDIAIEYHGTQQLRERIARTVRVAMLQSLGNSEQLDEVGSCNNHMNTPTAQAGNSPVIPDCWIPVSERMPEGSQEVLCAKEFDGPGDWRKKVGYWLAGKWTVYGASWTPTHWMPLPAAPQQEVKSALEHGMQRYAGAMQKLSEGDD